MTAPGASVRPAHAMTPVPDNVLRDAYLRTVFGIEVGLGIGQRRIAVVGIRGYGKQFRDATSGGNLIGKYDDAICVVTPTTSRTFLGNTDPTYAVKDGVGRAQLTVPQVFDMAPGIHGKSKPAAEQRIAFCPVDGTAGGVSIVRYAADGTIGPVLKGQHIGSNLHDGAITTTGSLACQTVAPEDWMPFLEMMFDGLGLPWAEYTSVLMRIKRGDANAIPDHWTKATFPYALVA